MAKCADKPTFLFVGAGWLEQSFYMFILFVGFDSRKVNNLVECLAIHGKRSSIFGKNNISLLGKAKCFF
ncbi:hypothetical protein Syun_012207 [Stephania yunnanensis]|uniref:Uncharacterized protein n=1 Tax=Stephania yunnanensis TaxID=152371 RepID=A0AAP0PG77_9MAGN